MAIEITKTKRRSREADWVKSLCPLLANSLKDDPSLVVEAKQRLPYRNEIHAYRGDSYKAMEPRLVGYQTDILIWEKIKGGWIPRVVIECKLGSVTTHDALTYPATGASQ